MFKRFVLTALVLGFSVSLFSQVNPDSLPEKYVKKVIIDAKWGDGPGEFGRVPYPKSDPPVGPLDFFVNERGNIYVLDEENHRVECFNNIGEFIEQIEYGKEITADSLAGFWKITTDNEGNLYLLGGKAHPELNGDGEICVYNRKGKFLGKIILPIKLLMSISVFKPFLHDSLLYFGQVIGAIDGFYVEDGSLMLRFGDSVYPVVDIHLLQSERKGFLLRKSSIKQPLNFYTSLEKTILKKVKSKEKWAHLIGRDKKGDFFIRKSINEVLKYSDTGELLAKITIPISQPKYDMGRDLFVSSEGAIYYWTNDNYRVKIIKLSKRGE